MNKRPILSTSPLTSPGSKAALDDDDDNTHHRRPYYHENFKIILDDVLSGVDREIFVKSETDLVQGFLSLSSPSQLLFVRLYLRKHRWMRVGRISYPDIATDLKPFVNELVKHDFLHDESQLSDMSECLELLQVSELKSLCRDLNLPSSLLQKQRQQIIDGVLKYSRQYKPLLTSLTPSQLLVKRCNRILDKCVRVSGVSHDVFSRIFLIFSLSFDDMDTDQSNGLQTAIFRILEIKMGRRVYPGYTTSITDPLFSDRQSFERYYKAHQLLAEISSILESKKVCVSELSRITSTATTELQCDVKPSTINTTATDSFIDLTSTDYSDTSDTINNNDCNGSRENVPTSPHFSTRYTAGHLYTNILTNCVEGWEKAREYTRANEVLELLLSQRSFNRYKRGVWLERHTLNLDYHLGDKDKCLSIIKQALDDNSLHPSKRLSLHQRAFKMLQQPTRLTGKRKRSSTTNIGLCDLTPVTLIPYHEVLIHGEQHPTSCLFMTKDIGRGSDSGCGSVIMLPVEGYAVHHYTTVEGWGRAEHCEGGLFATLFALLTWDILYCTGVPNVFRGRYQSLPMDFGRECYYDNRKEAIDLCLSRIEMTAIESIASEVCSVYDLHYGELCPLVNWDLFTCQDIKELVHCLGQSLLVQMCRIFSSDYYSNRGGLPDLVLWNTNEKRIKFVEVKGPGDRLSCKQIVWLSRLIEWGCEAEVCRVEGTR